VGSTLPIFTPLPPPPFIHSLSSLPLLAPSASSLIPRRRPAGCHAPSTFSFAGATARLDLAGAGSGRVWGGLEEREQAGVGRLGGAGAGRVGTTVRVRLHRRWKRRRVEEATWWGLAGGGSSSICAGSSLPRPRARRFRARRPGREAADELSSTPACSSASPTTRSCGEGPASGARRCRGSERITGAAAYSSPRRALLQ
jgi:hypothetical protein